MTKADPFKGKIHVHLGPEYPKTVCGLDPAELSTLPPKLAQHATCKRCIASLRKGP